MPRITLPFIIILLIMVLSHVNLSYLTFAENMGTVVYKVEHKYVCMITNKLFDNEQIKVVVDEKSYYGCCEMCKAKLEEDVTSRQSIDPVSGNTVDKAMSITGADNNGNIFYFENESNLNIFNMHN